MQTQIQFFEDAKNRSLNNNSRDKDTEEMKATDETLNYTLPVLVVVDHCDCNERKIGADVILRLVQKYNFSLIELSSISGVNLDFLIDYILNHSISQEIHDNMSTLNVCQAYVEENEKILTKLKNIYGDTMYTV